MERPLHRNREYVALWVGQIVSALGISISSFAYPLVVLAATGSPAKAGLVGSVLAGTTFFLRLPAGALVDRWNRKAILVVCDVGRALSAGVFAVTLALGHFFFAQVLVVAFLEGAFGVLFGPAEAAAVRRVVAPTQVRDAVARNQSRMQLAGLVGPPVGGVLLDVGRALPFVADAVSYLVSLVGVLFVRSALQDPEVPRPKRRIGAEVLDGVRWLWRRPFFRGVLVWMTLEGAAFSSIELVILVLARERGASSGQLGAMFAITAAGGVLGALATPWLLRHASPRALMLAFGWIGAIATLALHEVDSPYAIGVLGAAAFFLSPPQRLPVRGDRRAVPRQTARPDEQRCDPACQPRVADRPAGRRGAAGPARRPDDRPGLRRLDARPRRRRDGGPRCRRRGRAGGRLS